MFAKENLKSPHEWSFVKVKSESNPTQRLHIENKISSGLLCTN